MLLLPQRLPLLLMPLLLLLPLLLGPQPLHCDACPLHSACEQPAVAGGATNKPVRVGVGAGVESLTGALHHTAQRASVVGVGVISAAVALQRGGGGFTACELAQCAECACPLQVTPACCPLLSWGAHLACLHT